MDRPFRRHVSYALALVILFTIALPVRASSIVLQPPQLTSGGSATDFQFVSFQFDVYLVYIGDPVTDFAANVLANDRENYTFQPPCIGGGGKGGGGGCTTPPRQSAYTYADTYTQVTAPPSLIDAVFKFSGADAAGLPLKLTIADSGQDSVSLTDAAGASVAIGAPFTLTNQIYTLQLQTNSLAGSEVLINGAADPGTAAAVPEPASFEFMLTALAPICFAAFRWQRRQSLRSTT